MKRLTFILLIAAVTFLTYVTYQQEDHISDYKEYIDLLKESHEIEISRIINDTTIAQEKQPIDNIEWTLIIGDWELTKDSVEYIGRKDTVFVHNIDSLQYLWKYYRIQIEGIND